MVGDDVVHLAGDPGAFGGRGECDLLVSFAFQPLGAVVQFGQVGAAGGGVQAEAEGGGNQAGDEDRVIPPAGACEQEQPDQGGELEQAGASQRVPARPHRCHGVQGDEEGRGGDEVPVPEAAGKGDGHDPAEHRDGPDPADQQRRRHQGQHDNCRRARVAAVMEQLGHC